MKNSRPSVSSTLILVRKSKIKHLGFRRQIDQMRAAIEHHVRKEVLLVNLTSFGTRNSNSNRNFVLDQIRKIIIRAITRRCFYIEIPFGIGPVNPAVDKKDIRFVPPGVGNLSELEAPGSGLVIIATQNK
jgi:hypothetical protein